MLMEDVADQFLEQLINRCLVQVGKRDHTGIGVKTCHVHDLLRDLCVKKAQEENFLEIIQPPLNESDGNSLHVTLTASMARRIAIHPSKRTLRLWPNSYEGTKMVCFANEFLQLDCLVISGFEEFDEWQIEEGTMPRLRSLSLKGVSNLSSFPEGL
ncbi:hypothetical protein QQP08_004414, partial [Theobroma cacao]